MATSVQTTYSAEPAIGIAGQLADAGPHDVASANNSNAATIPAGVVVLRSGDRLVRPILSTDEPATAATAVVASGVASAAAAQVISGASLNGAVGQGEISPPKNLVLTLNNHADWDPSTIVVEGLNARGEPVSEAFEIANNGNATLTGVLPFSFVTAIKIPAQTGTNGTLTVGTGVKLGPIGKLAAGVALYDAAREPGAYAQYERLSVIKSGRVKVSAEAAVTAGNPVYVRFVATGGQVRGAMRDAPSSTDCALLPGARWASTTTGAGIAVVDVNLPS